MSIQDQPRTIISYTDSTASGTGTVNKTFMVPDNTNGIVVRIYCGTLTTVTADVYIQTSEDGGTTWRDCVHFPQLTAAVPIAQAQWASIPVNGMIGASYLNTAWVGSVAASTLAAGRASGLPLLGRMNRIFISYGGGSGTNAGINVDIYGNAQDSSL